MALTGRQLVTQEPGLRATRGCRALEVGTEMGCVRTHCSLHFSQGETQEIHLTVSFHLDFRLK